MEQTHTSPPSSQRQRRNVLRNTLLAVVVAVGLVSLIAATSVQKNSTFSTHFQGLIGKELEFNQNAQKWIVRFPYREGQGYPHKLIDVGSDYIAVEVEKYRQTWHISLDQIGRLVIPMK